MKKVLISLASFTLVASASLTVVSCKTSQNRTFNQLREYLNQIKGTYDEVGNPLTKSGASVVYMGAKDNASSQSFEASLKNTFGNDLHVATSELSKLDKSVVVSNPIAFDASGAQLDSNSLSISNLRIKGLSDDSDFVQLSLGRKKFDATVVDATSDRVTLQILNQNHQKFLGDLQEAFREASEGGIERPTSIVKTYKLASSSILVGQRQELYNQWIASYENAWISQWNADRGVLDVKMQLRSDRTYYGAILEQNSAAPTYGVKSAGGLELYAPITVGLDYANLKVNFHTFSFDKVSEYWSSDFFSRFSSFLEEDILYQLGANAALQRLDPEETEANERQIPTIRKRVESAQAIVSKIKAVKGPLFLFFKNGHLVDVRQGWNRYFDFGGNSSLDKEVYYSDLLSWAKELGRIWSQSAEDNLEAIRENGVQGWSHVWADDEGASNWDPERGVPK